MTELKLRFRRATLVKMAESADDEDKRRIAYRIWSIDNGGSDDAEFDGNTVRDGSREYLVLTDEEADKACRELVKESVWAFNSDFLASFTGFDSMVFEALADKCEDANDAILSIIEGTNGFDGFYEDAVEDDGRGHFLSSYDGEENEFSIGGEYFYIYRIN